MYESQDTRPSFGATPGSYTGPVQIVTPVHGVHIGENSDVYAEARFEIRDFYVWHCHIVEQEDNEMMRPFYMGPMAGIASVGEKNEKVFVPLVGQYQNHRCQSDAWLHFTSRPRGSGSHCVNCNSPAIMKATGHLPAGAAA